MANESKRFHERADAAELLEACEECADELNIWEEEFISNLSMQMQRIGALSDAQYDKLKQINSGLRHKAAK